MTHNPDFKDGEKIRENTWLLFYLKSVFLFFFIFTPLRRNFSFNLTREIKYEGINLAWQDFLRVLSFGGLQIIVISCFFNALPKNQFLPPWVPYRSH